MWSFFPRTCLGLRRPRKAYLSAMISFVEVPALSTRCVAAFVGYLCVLVLQFQLGFVDCEFRDRKEIPPQSLDFPYPRLLHERDVIHYRDSSGSFVTIGSGNFADVTLGELRGSGTLLAIKTFKDSPFRDIIGEIRLHRYVQEIGIVPRMIGLLPSGPLAGNISLVYEYLPFSKSLPYWIDEYNTFSTVQWVHICRQIALIMLRLHQHLVLFNDLHQGNVLIQKLDDFIRTYIIDFGYASYNSSKIYVKNYGNFSAYKFLAPEIGNGIPTTMASDIFALGYVLGKIANVANLTSLFQLAYWCMAHDPIERPSLLTVIARLDTILFEAALHQVQHFYNNGISPEENSVLFPRNDYWTLTRDNQVVVSERYLTTPANLIPTVSRFEQGNGWSWLTENQGFLSELCRIKLYVLDEYDLIQEPTENVTWISSSSHDAIRLAKLRLTNQLVIVKEFYKVPFDTIRKESCWTGFFAEKNVSPKILGILVEYKNMNDSAFVQEVFGNGVSLTEFINVSLQFEWDRAGLEQVAKREVTSDVQNIEAQSCQYRSIDLFLDIVNDFFRGTCKIKSYRRLIVERISTLLIQRMKLVHDSGYLINNFRTNNVLIQWLQPKNGSMDDVDIRFIDLGLISPISRGIYISHNPEYLSQFTYLAPEVVQGHRTTRSSDIYSLCFALYNVMNDYFSYPGIVSLEMSSKFGVNYNSNTSTSSQSSEAGRTNDFFVEYYKLLQKCLHGQSSERPGINDILRSLNLAC